MKINAFSLLFCFFLVIVFSNAKTCKRDKLLTKTESEVDWWFIIKIKGFTDLYLYFDSVMEESGTQEFMKGSFLRSKYSALGLTLLPYTGVTDHKYFAIGDSLLVYDEKGNRRKDQMFYKDGAHEKNFFGLGTDLEQGVHIQHSLPQFPSVYYDSKSKKQFLSPPMDPKNFMDYYDSLDKEVNPPFSNSMDFFYLFSKMGWEKPFFNSNLCSYQSQKDLNDMGLPEEENTDQITPGIIIMNSINNYGDGIKKTMGSKVSGGEASDLNCFGIIHTNDCKPSQHIFCNTIRKKDEFIHLIENMAPLSNKGLYSPLHNLDQANQNQLDPTNKYLSLVGLKTATVDNSQSGIKVFGSPPLPSNSKTKFYHKVNYGISNNIDVWKNAFFSTILPITAQPSLATDETVYISTWSKVPNDKFWYDEKPYNTKVFIPSFAIDMKYKLGKVVWTGSCKEEHSKIAFKKEETIGSVWNVCVSGGNLYEETRESSKDSPIKGSLLTCFKADNLNAALKKIVASQRSDKDWALPKNELSQSFLEVIEKQRSDAKSLTQALSRVQNEFKCELKIACKRVVNERLTYYETQFDLNTIKPLPKPALPFDGIVKIEKFEWYELLQSRAAADALQWITDGVSDVVRLNEDHPTTSSTTSLPSTTSSTSPNKDSTTTTTTTSSRRSRANHLKTMGTPQLNDSIDVKKKAKVLRDMFNVGKSGKNFINKIPKNFKLKFVHFKPDKKKLADQYDAVSTAIIDSLTWELLSYYKIDGALERIHNRISAYLDNELNNVFNNF
ncbi:hypothetical protein CYY_004840 [Polysphondylium violaceum]|uniref:Uncharacterized protein n=1 Tax=Polysphondylium violaceum TaxID=133409 RepID=A0A8J4V7D5_9MYCE|nr:hypothetical protein CYY_004840 [Polysphondylium violaceum]